MCCLCQKRVVASKNGGISYKVLGHERSNVSLVVSKQMETPELCERAPGRGFMMTMRQRSGSTSGRPEHQLRLAPINSCRIHSHTARNKNAHCCPPCRLVAVDDLSLPSSPCSVSPPRLPPALALGAPPSHAPSPMALLKSMSGVIYSVVRPVEVHPCPS